MEGIPSGDIQSKYQKLAAEYSKLRVHVKVLKKGVLDEQAKSNELKETLKQKEKSLRKSELEIDSLTFRNQQLTRRVSFLQEELEASQLKLSKKSKGKNEEKAAPSSMVAPLDPGLLQEELQKKIIENAHCVSQLSDRVFEVSQLKATIEDYQKSLSDSESKSKCEIAKLKNKIQELQYSVEEINKVRTIGTPNRINLPSCSQAASCNGDFTSEGGSLMGSEDALSSIDDLHINEQISVKTQALDQDNGKLRMEFELLQMENESLKLELVRHTSTSQKRNRSEGHDSGDFNTFGTTDLDGEGRVTGLLGSLQVPFVLTEEIQAREERLKTYFRNKMTELKLEKEQLESKTEHHMKECESLQLRFEELERDKQTDVQTLQDKHNTISRLEEELHSTSTNYEQQMCVLTEHLASLNDQLTRQHDEIQHLKQTQKKK